MPRTTQETFITIAHSPDADDIAMLWPLASGIVDSGQIRYSFETGDIGELNRKAQDALFDVTALSAAAYVDVADSYLIVPYGASIGRGFGPRLVSTQNCSTDALRGHKIGVPGITTTAATVVSMAIPDIKLIELPTTPFERVFEALNNGTVDAAVLVHEAQLSGFRQNYSEILNLGKWWADNYTLPLPLGINVIRRSLKPQTIRIVSEALKNSVSFAVTHTDEAVQYLKNCSNYNLFNSINPDDLKQYLAWFANQDSTELTEDVREALDILLTQSAKIRAIPPVTAEYSISEPLISHGI